MSAAPLSETEPLRSEPSVWDPLPDWVFPPERGFTADDLDRLHGIPPHTELIDGTLVFVSPQTNFHMSMLFLLESELRRTVPGGLTVRREMTVTLGRRQRPEPDIMVVRADAVQGPRQTTYRPQDVVLAVEVVSPESEIRDRERKPRLYAESGITHFWLVENTDGEPSVHVYELDRATTSYVPTGIHRGRLKLDVPFAIDIDLSQITRI
nr:Uma2 family endonuclease [Planomonospora venezuelensis]